MSLNKTEGHSKCLKQLLNRDAAKVKLMTSWKGSLFISYGISLTLCCLYFQMVKKKLRIADLSCITVNQAIEIRCHRLNSSSCFRTGDVPNIEAVFLYPTIDDVLALFGHIILQCPIQMSVSLRGILGLFRFLLSSKTEGQQREEWGKQTINKHWVT